MAKKPKPAAKEETEGGDAEADEDAAQAAAPKRKLPLKLIVIAVAVLAVVGGGGTAGYLMLLRGQEKSAAAVVQAKPAAFIEVPEVLVNLSNTGSDRTQYLKVKVVLEVPDAALTPQIETTMPRVMDAFQTYLRELRPTDLDGSAGLYRLKEELTRRVNAAIAPSRINAVLFKEIVVQ
jgi:flagellar protein FliL